MIAPAKIKKSKAPPEDRPLAEALLIAYHMTGDIGYRDHVVLLYQPLVWTCVAKEKAKAYMPAEELFSLGIEGVIRSTEKWLPERNVSFGYFVGQRIYYAIKEGLRSMAQSTRTQRERGEAKTFSTLSEVASEGAREHRDYAEHDLLDEFTAVVERANLDWPERLLLVLAFREGYTANEIAETFDETTADVKRAIAGLKAKLGDGRDAPKAPAKIQRAEAERVLQDVFSDVRKFAVAGMNHVAVQLLLSARRRTSKYGRTWVPALMTKIERVAQRWGFILLPDAYDAAMQADPAAKYRPKLGRDYTMAGVDCVSEPTSDAAPMLTCS